MDEAGVDHYRYKSLESLASDHALIDYYFNKDEGIWVVENIESNKPGEGSKIVRKFVNKIGKDQPVRFIAVIEPETKRTLKNMGVLTHIEKTQQALKIRNKATFKSLKVGNLLMNGGIEIEKISLKPIPEELIDKEAPEKDRHKVEIEIFGKTKK